MKTLRIPALLCTLIACIIILCPSCRKVAPPPSTCIATLPDTVYIPDAVTFLSCTKGASAYLWSFGDGTTATTDSVVHRYAAAGTYHGSLTTGNGQTKTEPFTIIVVANPIGYFTVGDTTYQANYRYVTNGGVEVGIAADSILKQSFSVYFYHYILPTAFVRDDMYWYPSCINLYCLTLQHDPIPDTVISESIHLKSTRCINFC